MRRGSGRRWRRVLVDLLYTVMETLSLRPGLPLDVVQNECSFYCTACLLLPALLAWLNGRIPILPFKHKRIPAPSRREPLPSFKKKQRLPVSQPSAWQPCVSHWPIRHYCSQIESRQASRLRVSLNASSYPLYARRSLQPQMHATSRLRATARRWRGPFTPCAIHLQLRSRHSLGIGATGWGSGTNHGARFEVV